MRKYVLKNLGNYDRYYIQLTDEQIRLLEFIEYNRLNYDSFEFEEVDSSFFDEV